MDRRLTSLAHAMALPEPEGASERGKRVDEGILLVASVRLPVIL
jgi:hypothetical protein